MMELELGFEEYVEGGGRAGKERGGGEWGVMASDRDNQLIVR